MIELIIVIVLILIMCNTNMPGYAREKMSNGYSYLNKCSWMGFLTSNDIDEIKASAINKNPFMDYTYTYWNGVQRLSCDECPNKYVCEECPQMKAPPGYFADPNTVDDNVPGSNAEYFISDDVQPANGKDTPNVYDTPTRPDQQTDTVMPSHDMDNEYKMSRDHMGAVRTPASLHGGNLTAMVGESTTDTLAADEKFGQLRMLGGKPYSSSPAMKLLYVDIMGLQNPLPSKGDCEYLRYNGYLYKEPCDYKEYTTN
jgi:hypothetical protein